jgi:hypothetical protein
LRNARCTGGLFYWRRRAVLLAGTQVEGARGTMSSAMQGDFEEVGVPEKDAPDGDAVSGLRAVLFSRDRSGLFRHRIRALDALGALGATDVIEDYLRLDRCLADPLERIGEDAVISHAARRLARAHRADSFALLLEVAQRHKLDGVVAALGSYRKREAIPVLIAALREDEARLSAEAALRLLLGRARPALLKVAAGLLSAEAPCDESHLRQGRSCVALLIELGAAKIDQETLAALMAHKDRQVAILACKLCLSSVAAADRKKALRRLRGLRASASWSEKIQIDGYLRPL